MSSTPDLGAPQGRTGGEGVMYDYVEVPSFQISVYEHRATRPSWYERGMVYQIFPIATAATSAGASAPRPRSHSRAPGSSAA